MRPEIHVLGISIKTFGICFALNFVAWGLVAARRLKELERPADWAYELVFAAILGGLVGARGYYLLQNHVALSVGNIFSGSGLIWYGGLIGGVIAVVLWAWWRRFLTLDLLDIGGVGLALGYAIGRIGCQVSGDGDYGIPWHGPWAMSYRHGTVPTPPGVTVHPTPIYETLSMGLVAWILWRLRDKVRAGVLFAGYLVLGGTERFLVEFIRQNHVNAARNHDLIAGLDPAQIESLVELAIGVVWLVVVARRSGLLRDGGVRLPRRAAATAA